MRIHREVPRSFFTHLVSSTKNGVIDTRGLYRPLPRRIQTPENIIFPSSFLKRETQQIRSPIISLSPKKREERVSPHSQRVNIEEPIGRVWPPPITLGCLPSIRERTGPPQGKTEPQEYLCLRLKEGYFSRYYCQVETGDRKEVSPDP
jgi:hypothetical protein